MNGFLEKNVNDIIKFEQKFEELTLSVSRSNDLL